MLLPPRPRGRVAAVRRAGLQLEHQQLRSLCLSQDGALIYRADASSSLHDVVLYGFLQPNAAGHLQVRCAGGDALWRMHVLPPHLHMLLQACGHSWFLCCQQLQMACWLHCCTAASLLLGCIAALLLGAGQVVHRVGVFDAADTDASDEDMEADGAGLQGIRCAAAVQSWQGLRSHPLTCADVAWLQMLLLLLRMPLPGLRT